MTFLYLKKFCQVLLSNTSLVPQHLVLYRQECCREYWSSSSEPGHSGQYLTATVSPSRVTSISREHPSLLPHGSFHQGFFYLDWPGPWPLSTDSPKRLQESLTGPLWRRKQNLTGLSFLFHYILCACVYVWVSLTYICVPSAFCTKMFIFDCFEQLLFYTKT